MMVKTPRNHHVFSPSRRRGEGCRQFGVGSGRRKWPVPFHFKREEEEGGRRAQSDQSKRRNRWPTFWLYVFLILVCFSSWSRSILRERKRREGGGHNPTRVKEEIDGRRSGFMCFSSWCVSHPGPVACGSTHYDVFLSFPEGSDATPDSFPRRLHASLAAAEVSVCRPDESQAIGSSSSLLPDAAVRRSKICIPILSQDYASSDRCLRRLVQMMEGKRSGRQMLLPIFNRVEPSDLRYLKGSFEEARHSDIEGVQEALIGVSDIHGLKVTEGCEEEVETVVHTILRCLGPDLQTVSQSTKYNVFLNFRGADTRKGIAQDLYNGLIRAGVSVFKDDTDLLIGEEFGSQLLSAISRSTIYITVFSPNYISSKWCLQELVEMTENMRSNAHIVIPVFHEVRVADLKYFGGDRLRSRKRRLGETAIRKGMEALRRACDSAGLETEKFRDNEQLIRSAVQGTLRLLWGHFQLDVPEDVLRRYDLKIEELRENEMRHNQ